MFASTSSSHSSSLNFGCPTFFGQGKEKGDEFVPKTFGSETMFGSPTGMSNYGGNYSTWAFSQTSSPLFSTASGLGAPSNVGFGSSIPAFGLSSVHSLGSSSSTSVEGHSTSGKFSFPTVFMQGNQREDSSASTTLCSTDTFGSPIGMPSSHGTSTWGFNQTSSPFSTPTIFGATSSHGLWSFTSGGSPVTKSTFNVKESHCVGEGSGSRIANYKRTADATSSAEKLISISAMPVYKAKNHEELRWEDYKSDGKGGFGINPSGAKSISSSVTKIPTISWGTPSISTTPLKPNPFENTFPSVATETPSWNFPGPTFTSRPLFCSSSANTPLTCSSATSLKSFNPFVPRTTHTSSVSFAPLNRNPFTNPFTSLSTQMSSLSVSSPTFPEFTWGQDKKPSSLNDFWSTPIDRPPISIVTEVANSVSVLPASSALTSTFNQPSVSATQNCSEAIGGIIGQSPVGQLSLSQITSEEQPSSAASPFGTLPPKPQKLYESSLSMQSTQYGISSIPVKDNLARVRHLLPITRHLSRRSNLPVRKYDPKLNGLKVPFFRDTKEIPVALYVPRDNPRALVVGPEMWRPRDMIENKNEERFSRSMYENKRNDLTENKGASAIVLDVPSKLQQPDYYTEPQISELEAKEMAKPGFCSHVKDLVVGRHGYGSIKFIGETDVRMLDLETIVQFNNREVIVYIDDIKKPPVGEGLNKPAEITLLNVKCIDKKTGMQYTDGPKIIKYTEMLKEKAMAQGAEFISYDPVRGEWKFRVKHF